MLAMAVYASFVTFWPYNLSLSLKNYNFDVIDDWEVIGDKEKKCMTGIEVLNNINNTKEEINVDGFFVAILQAKLR